MGIFPKKRSKTFNQKIKPQTQLRFLTMLQRNLSSGYPLSEALEMLKWDKALEPIASRVIQLVKDGNSFPLALEKMKFHSIIISFLSVSKEYGNLEDNIAKTMTIYEKRIQYNKKFKQVIRYPTILIIVFSFLFFFIQHSVLPNLLVLLQDDGSHSNIITNTLTISTVFYYLFLLFIVIFLLSRWCWPYIQAKMPIPAQIKLFKCIPFYRGYLKLNTSYLFSTHLSALLQTGIPIKDVLMILKNQPRIPLISHYASIITDGLNRGIHVSVFLRKFTFINPQLAAIFQKNSNAESLEKDLAVYAAFLMEELHQKIIKAITYIQPIFFGLLGLVIIFIYLSLMWPMFEMIETI